MKHIFTGILLLIVNFITAQTVYIADSNFKKQLIGQFDTNHDGELQNSEALGITDLTIMPVQYDHDAFGNPISLISVWPSDFTGIEKFTNLEKFTCNYPNQNFDYLVQPAGRNRNLSFRNNSHLKVIYYTGDTSFSRIDLVGCINLDTLTLSSVPHAQDDLSFAGVNYNFDSLDLSVCPNLRVAFMSYFLGLKTLRVQGCDSLKRLSVYSSNVNNIDVHGLPNLEDLLVLNSANLPDPAMSVNAANAPRLTHIGLIWPEIANLNVSGCGALNAIDAISPNFSAEQLDLSGAPNLSRLYLSSSGGRLSYLNLKNGTALDQMNISCSPPLQYVCADDFEADTLRQYFNGQGQYVNVNPYCNFGPSGRYNTIKGTARFNFTGSTCSSSNRPVKMMPVKISENNDYVLSLTDTAGNYKTYTGKGEFNLAPYFPYSYFNVNPAAASVSFDTANSITTVRDFCIQPNGTHNDLEITFLPSWPRAIPGFNAAYDLIYKNKGTTTLSGNVQLNFDNGKMNFIVASENVTSQSAGQLSWSYSNLQPFESKIIKVTFNLLPPPVNNVGDTITYLAAINPSASDETAFDNSFILPQQVRSSYDPNEKQCLEGSKIDISRIGDYLHYQIHFQNEGTDTAFNIVIADTLSNKLDWNTLELISSSHPVDVRIKNNKAEFIFENIKLPYKAINEPASNGYVAFKIKPKPSVVIGDSLNNTAAIYFDFNLPVITNKATTIVTSASTPVAVKLEYFSAVKKENANWLRWKASCTAEHPSFIIERSDNGIHFKEIGNANSNIARCQLPYDFTDNNPVAGKNYYRLKMQDADGRITYSKTLVVSNTKAGFEIAAVSNGSVYFNSNIQQQIKLQVLTADGKLIYADIKNILAGPGQKNLQLKTVAGGIYTLIVQIDEGVVTKRFIK